ncbi:MAG: hypothetical protein CR997_11795 [Acidobacteria bacterium]|nr:MAG: hypothetical protein CR997_11795 [Acidobacteriota bacterium]
MTREKTTCFKWIFFTFLILHFVVVFGVARKGYFDVFEERTISPENQILQIPSGQTLNELLEELETRKMSPQPFWVKLVMFLEQRQFIIKKGRYRLAERMSTWQILEKLDNGLVETTKITIQEGLEKWEVADLLGKTKWGDRDQFKELIQNSELIYELDPGASDLEGYLFPETYYFEDETTPEQIIRTLVEHFKNEMEPHLHKLTEMKLTVREWVTLASMVEKETAKKEERKRIAGVFLNRKRRGMQYQCDPTIVYALKREGKYRGKIFLSDLKFNSPYNTYVAPGLPPGPIASPGKASLMAVLEPEDHPYLYFVSKNDGSHHFSKTLSEHNRNVQRYQR